MKPVDLRPLKGQWVLAPSVMVSVVVLAVAIYYGTLVVSLEGSQRLLIGLGVAMGCVFVPLGLMRGRKLVPSLIRVAERPETAPPSLLRAAAEEVCRYPNHQFKVTLQHWCIGGLVVAGGLFLFGDISFGKCLRVFGIPVVLGPTSALLAQVATSLRVRQSLRTLSALGLPASQLVEALPRSRQLMARFVLLAAVTALTPVLLTAEFGIAHARSRLAHVASLSEPEVRAQAVADVRKGVVVHLVVLGVVMGALAVIGASLVGSALGGPVVEIAEEAARIVDGHVTSPKVIPAEDEVWALSAAFTQMHERLDAVLVQLKQAGTRIGVTSQQILATAARFESTATSQASSLNQTTTTTEELARSAGQIAENAASVSSSADKTLEVAREGQTFAEAFTRTMERMREDNRSVSAAVAKLQGRVLQIGRIVEFINSIADKSDLLALSAELEGTKAGEVGRGFGLVGSEMRRLAENVIESTREIAELIREIREATMDAVRATEGGVRATEEGGRYGTEVAQGLEEIVSLAHQTTEAVRGISYATQQQQNGTDQLAQSMSQILQVTEVNVRASRHVAARNAELSTLAERLKALVDGFESGRG